MLRKPTALVAAALLALMTAPLIAAEPASADPLRFPPLKEAMSSFGATVCDGYAYVFGGHIGRIPGNSIDGLSSEFCRLNLKQPGATWESLAMLEPSQSPALVTWNGKLYRVGGLSFKNKVGEETKFHSLDIFACFDPATKEWTRLPSLPEPRSSLDAAVVDGQLYVVGGWNLQEGGSQNADWHDDVLAFDLSKPDGQWKPVAKPPFSTRALAAASHDGKLYVLGGMTSENKVTQDVHIYDPKTNQWSAGPELAGGEGLSGFAISAFADGGKLYYSGSEGVVYRLSDDGKSWVAIERLVFPRSFHRLVADDGKVLVIAGVARGGGYLANLEEVDATSPREQKLVEWSVEFGGKVKQSQGLLLQGSSLYAFGGNNSWAAHDFTKEMFSDEAYRFDLAARTVERLPNLPKPLQGPAVVLTGSRIDQSIYLLGGLGMADEKFQSLDTILRYRLRSKAWADEIGRLPATRSMFSATTYNGDVWMFGGAEVNAGDQGLVTQTWRWKSESDSPAEAVAGAYLPSPRRSYGGALLGDRYYVVGGLGPNTSIAESAFAFDFKTEQWQEIASPLVDRVFPSLDASGDKLYLFGGFARVDGHFQPARSLEVYDPAANKWQMVHEQLPFAKQATTMLEFQDRLLFYGIDSERDGLAHFTLLDPSPTTVGFGKPASTGSERTPSSEMLQRLLRFDRNNDGKLTKEEVGERFQPIIERADADKDGAASKEELEALTKSAEPQAPGRD